MICQRTTHSLKGLFQVFNQLFLPSRTDFYLFKRRGRKISGGVQAAPLSELRQGLGRIE
jgi:hypothetical protein